MKNNLVNAKTLISLADQNQFAIPQININNLEWIQATLEAAQQAQSPIILGVSLGASKYMGGYKIIVDMVNTTIERNNFTIPVTLHLDHGTYESCLEAIEAGFSSVMFDGSSLSFKENLMKTKELVLLCQQKNISLEVEVGSIGGYEDGDISHGELANIDECKLISEYPIDFLAAGIGNIHGLYPDNWKGLNFDLLSQIRQTTNKALVLHGGSGIPNEMIIKAIQLGVRKINVNTECQIAFSQAIQKYFNEHLNILKEHAYDPRKYLKLGKQAIIDVCLEKMKLFGSYNQIKQRG